MDDWATGWTSTSTGGSHQDGHLRPAWADTSLGGAEGVAAMSSSRRPPAQSVRVKRVACLRHAWIAIPCMTMGNGDGLASDACKVSANGGANCRRVSSKVGPNREEGGESPRPWPPAALTYPERREAGNIGAYGPGRIVREPILTRPFRRMWFLQATG